MISLLRNALVNVRIADILDIAVITVLLYFIFIWLRQRASRSVIIALAGVVALYSCAHLFNMYITSMIFQTGLTAALIALVLIFQEDIRMAIEQISTWGFYRSKHTLVASSRTVDCLVESFTSLARDKIGALVVVKGRDSLERHLSGGISLNGRLSTPLLYSIFHPVTPSHDGAVIIEGERIEKFGVRLPLSHNLAEVGDAGTRHTAALGMSERSDALVIVASEERGTISLAEQGRLERVSPELLRTRLDGFYRKIFPEPETGRRHKWLTKNFSIKLSAAGLAVLLWFLLAFRMETVNRTFTVPVEYRNVPSNWTIDNPRPARVELSLSGIDRAFGFDPATLVASLDMSGVHEGTQVLRVDGKDINIPSGLKISGIIPSTISVTAWQFDAVDLPVKLRTIGTVRKGMTVADIRMQPLQIRTLVPHRKRGRYSEIPTEPLDLGAIHDNFTARLGVVLPADVRPVNENDTSVRIFVTLNRKSR